MIRFVCVHCGQVWYSAAKQDKPCGNCGGRLEEETPADRVM